MEKETFQSDTISLTIERKPDCMVEYLAKATPTIVIKAREQALRLVSKQVSIPGFRKGKAPGHLIEKKYPKPLEEEWKKQIANLSFVACQKTHFTPLLDKETKISFQMKTFSIEEGAEMTFLFESEPVVPEIDTSTIELEEIAKEEVDDKKIDQVIHQIQTFFSSWETITDRAVQWEDYATIDATLIEEDPPKKALENARFEVTQEKLAKWMSDLLIGMKIGETREGVSQPDQDATQEAKEKSVPKKVNLTLLKIEKPNLPPIDDALAKKVGASSALQMKESLKKLLQKQEEEKAKKEYRDQINIFLLKHYSFDLPQSMLKREIESRIKQVVNDPTSLNKLSKMSEEEKKDLVSSLEEQSKKALLLFYLTRKVVEDHNISISPKEVESGPKTLLESMFQDNDNLYHPKRDSREQKALAFSRLVLEKAEDHLIEQATLVPPKIEPPSEPPQ